MIALETLKVGDVVRLASGSPKFMVEAINTKAQTVDLWGWADRHGFVSEPDVPAAFLVWPKRPSDEKDAD